MAAPDEINVRILQLGRRVVDFRAEPGRTMAFALEATGIQLGPGFEIRVNGTIADATTLLQDGDVVTLIPRIKGG